MDSNTFTREYFLNEMSQMHRMMGDRSFWSGNKPSNAMRGLTYVYMNTKDLTDRDKTSMIAITTEFDLRLAMALDLGIYEGGRL